MKLKQKLTAGITLINKRYKEKEFYHYFKEPDNVILIPIIKGKFLIFLITNLKMFIIFFDKIY